MSGFLSNDEHVNSQRRTLIAVGVAGVLLYAWQAIFPPPVPPPIATEEGSVIQVEGSSTAGTAEGSGFAASPDVPVEIEPQHLRSEYLDVAISNVGGRIHSVQLLAPAQYLPRTDMAAVFPDGEDTALPLGLELGIESLQPDTIYAFVEGESTRDGDHWSSLTYRRVLSNGLQVTRTFELTDDAFGMRTSVEVTNQSGDRIRLPDVRLLLPGSLSSDAGGGMLGGSGSMLQTLCHGDFGTRRRPARKASEPRTYEGQVAFAGINENYFLAAVSPDAPESTTACVVEGLDDEHAQVSILHGEITLEPGAATTLSWLVYNGPKDVGYLEAFDRQLDQSLDFGWFSFIAVPIRGVLLWIQQYVVNWGFAIIVLTLLLNVLLYPMRRSMYANSRKMADMNKVLQPRLKEIEERYPNDPMKKAEEQARVMKELNMNPLAGCLPMLLPLFIQMPIFIAMYRAIWSSTELYNASFGLWIVDLSRPDPYFVLPIVIGGLFYLQQKLMPAPSVDNPQFNMMQKIMPPMFTLMMLFMPSGLVLYSLVNTIVSIVQQKIHGSSGGSTLPSL
jgi:YidC/Oxa1 family membrane protein insertase